MIKFCLDLKECRKLKFTKCVSSTKSKNRDTDGDDRHFSSTDFSWAEDKTPCGHCDNCLRDPATVVEKDVTSEAKRVLAVARALAARNTNFTAALLARTARGNSDLAKSLNLAQSDRVALSLIVRRSSGGFFSQHGSLSARRRTRRFLSRTSSSKDT
jgi:ATP-dependent DNA helicase Q1